ncbi:MAG: hypothetical protein H8F28_00645 [Fibrella sp.]|nr:hypothetical protein [Armatimonadota bacterium]
MSELITPYADTIRRFHDAGVRFVIIGGVAMGLHGSDVPTYGVDVAYAIEPENLERLAKFLPTIHARVIGRPRNDSFIITTNTLMSVKFLNLSTDLGAIDVMRQIPGVDSFDGLWERAVPMEIEDFTVHVASLDDLIAMKRAANRAKDQIHLLELSRIKQLQAETAIAKTRET